MSSFTILSLRTNTTATNHLSTLSLHDALPISYNKLTGLINHSITVSGQTVKQQGGIAVDDCNNMYIGGKDRKSTRLNSSHSSMSYSVLCLKKKICLTINGKRYYQDVALRLLLI